MRRYFTALGTLIFLIGSAQAFQFYVSAGNSVYQLPTDANGWTVFPGPTTGTLYYASDSFGSDSAGSAGTGSGACNGLYPIYTGVGATCSANANGPFKTINKGVTTIGSSTTNDNYLLLRKGDTFQGQAIAGGLVLSKGLSPQHPMVIGSYTESQPSVVDPYGNNTIQSITCNAGVVTVTTVTNHGYNSGNEATENLVITQTLPYQYDGNWAATITSATQFQFSIVSCPGSSTLNGIVTTRRPLMEPLSTEGCGPSDGGNGVDYTVVVGIECYAYQADPSNPLYNGQIFKSMSNAGAEAWQSLHVFNWRMFEDNETDFLYGTFSITPNGGQGNALIMRCDVSYKNWGGGGGTYLGSLNNVITYEEMQEFNGWNSFLTGPTSVTITGAGTAPPTGSIVNWTNNPLANDDSVQFTAGTLPGGMSAAASNCAGGTGTGCYYAENVTSTGFTLSTTKSNANPVTLSSTGSAVVGYWQQYQPSLVTAHCYYVQNLGDGGTPTTGILSLTMNGNICGFQSADAVEGGEGGSQTESVFYQAAAFLDIMGKSGQVYRPSTYSITYSGMFEPGWFYTSPNHSSTSSISTTCCGLGGITNTWDHNLVLYSTPEATAGATGILPETAQTTFPLHLGTWTNNIACGMGTAVANNLGLVLNYDATYNSGFTWTSGLGGYTPNSGSGTYSGSGYAQPYTIPLVGGTGTGALAAITVNGTSGQVTGVSFVYGGLGAHYSQNDVLSPADNSLVGGSGSGLQYTLDTVSGGEISTGHISNPGSGYLAPYNNVAMSKITGSGVGGYFDVVVNGSGQIQKVYVEPLGQQGHGYATGDHVGFGSGGPPGGSGGYVTVGLVTGQASQLSFSGNTLQSGNCNSLSSATSSVNGYASVAPPGSPSATPPTDVVGGYFASLPYGYSETIPGVFYNGATAQTTGYEMAFSDYIALQQKGNWDNNLMPHALLNWARPQFGMNNP